MAESRSASLPPELRVALAEDLETLALLQDRELGAELLQGLRQVGFPDNLGLRPGAERAVQAFDLMRGAVATLPPAIGPAVLDQLAADYAAIYLNASLGASPMESVWLSDDHTSCHDAMFELRRHYAAHGLAASDWRRRPDDHLVLQLQFVAHRLRDPDASLAELADFLDHHPLRWLDDFAARVAARCDTAFYAGLALLAAAQVDGLRDILARSLGQPRPSRQEVAERCRARRGGTADSLRFVPGTGPGW